MARPNRRANSTSISRRAFVRAVATTAAAFTIVSEHVFAEPPSDKLNIAGVGVGGVGLSYLKGVESQNIVALCDVDDAYADKAYKAYPNARKHRDFRKMLEQDKTIDAVVIGTPDHTHAVVAATALKLGKHVYCAKPLTRTIHESRILAQAARQAKVATQMSVQSDAEEDQRVLCELIWAGAIGNIREVHVWSNRPIWPQGLDRPTETPPVPATLDWDLWLGPAPYRPYHPCYVPFKWRGWWDFGTGALGDMGCHTFAHIFKALKLTHPTSVHASSTRLFPETAPWASIVHYDFPARDTMPAVKVTWYDGGLKPRRPDGLDGDKELAAEGLFFVGDKGTLFCGFTGGNPRILPESRAKEFQPPAKTLPRSVGHYREWIDACKGGQPAGCNFDFAGTLNEVVLLGNIAVRLASKKLYWDPANMKFTNDDQANRFITEPYRQGWSL